MLQSTKKIKEKLATWLIGDIKKYLNKRDKLLSKMKKLLVRKHPDVQKEKKLCQCFVAQSVKSLAILKR